MAEHYAGSPVAPLADKLPAGSLALVLARAGVGKTALLVHAALGALLDGRQVLHVALRDTVDHTRAHYDELLRAVGDTLDVSDAALRIERARMIHSFHGRRFDAGAVARHLDLLAEAAQFRPDVLVVDGFEASDLDGWLKRLAGLAAERQLTCWVSVHSEAPVPAAVFEDCTLVVRLVPDGTTLRLHRVHGVGEEQSVPLDPSTLLAVGTDAVAARPADRVEARGCTLYSGGAAGSEAAFGEVAERWGVHEVSFTFDGHLQTRTRGRYELSPRELAMGDVSLSYVSKRLNRGYNDRGGLIRGVLQTLWHMVSRSQQVFVIGTIQEDGTVRGGTGWSVELARMWNRDLWVFDQERQGWYRWDGHGWAAGHPEITAPHVCGTGTRKVTDAGRQAIEALFRDSFAGRS